jgi:hypothetical protein
VQAIFYNLEVWINLRQQDHDKLEVIQGKVLKGLFGLPKATPYWGILHEFNILPVHLRLIYRKLMVYHTLMNSEEKRIARRIVVEQENSGLENCWFSDVKKEGESIGIGVERDKVLDVPKSAWKRIVKIKIKKSFEEKCREKIGNMTKLRFLDKCSASETFLKNNEVVNDDAREAIKIRLNMVEAVTQNFGAGTECTLCGDNNDSTEHVFVCKSLGEHDLTLENLICGTRMLEIVKLFRKMEDMKRDYLIESIITNFNVFHREELSNKSEFALNS